MAMPLAAISVQPDAQFTIRGNFQGATATAARQRAALIAQAGGAAAIIVSDAAPSLDHAFEATAAVSRRGTYGIDSAGGPAGAFARRRWPRARATRRPQVPSLWVRHDKLDLLRATGGRAAFDEHLQRDVQLSVRKRDRRRERDGSAAGERIRVVQRAPGSRRRAIFGEWRLDLEWRGRQCHGERRVARGGARIRQASCGAAGALCVARRGRARATRLAMVLRVIRRCRARRSSLC